MQFKTPLLLFFEVSFAFQEPDCSCILNGFRKMDLRQGQFLLDTAMVCFLCMSLDETLEQGRNASR